MSTAILKQIAKPESRTSVTEADIDNVRLLDVFDLGSVSTKPISRTLSNVTDSTDVALINNLSVRPSITTFQRLYARLHDDTSFVARPNATHPKREVFKAACLNSATSPKTDQKNDDWSVDRLQELRGLDPALVQESGEDFLDVLDFYTVVEAGLLPVLTRVASSMRHPDHGAMNIGIMIHTPLSHREVHRGSKLMANRFKSPQAWMLSSHVDGVVLFSATRLSTPLGAHHEDVASITETKSCRAVCCARFGSPAEASQWLWKGMERRYLEEWLALGLSSKLLRDGVLVRVMKLKKS